jgi:hypothetical protein
MLERVKMLRRLTEMASALEQASAYLDAQNGTVAQHGPGPGAPVERVSYLVPAADPHNGRRPGIPMVPPTGKPPGPRPLGTEPGS